MTMGSTEQAVEDDDHCHATRPSRPSPNAAASSPCVATSGRKRRSELRQAMARSRARVSLGLGFIVAGVLLGLAIYLDLAGTLGRGARTVGRVLAGLGSVRRCPSPSSPSASPSSATAAPSTATGWRSAWAAARARAARPAARLRGPDEVTGRYDDVRSAGGWIGAVVGEPLREPARLRRRHRAAGRRWRRPASLLRRDASLRTMFARAGHGRRPAGGRTVGAPASAPPGASSTRCPRWQRAARRRRRGGAGRAPASPYEPLPPTTLYDVARRRPDAKRRRPARHRPPPTGRRRAAGDRPRRPARPAGAWRCRRPTSSNAPPASRSTARPGRGPRPRPRATSLASHGVETRLVGHDGRPDRHPLRAGARARASRSPG